MSRDFESSQETPLREVLGSTHVAGLYNFTDDDHLNEGAARLEDFGTRVVRIWDSNDQGQTSFRYNMDWPESFDSVTDVFRDDHVREFFDRSFATYVLTTYARSTPGVQDHYWREGVTDEQYEATVEEYAEATRHLLETYDGTGKTFVFQNWEGDWAILDTVDQEPPEPTDQNVEGMVRWLSARQEGVERGRADVESDASVLHAVSVNRVRAAMEGERRVANAVVPEVDPDLDMVAYSSWDVTVDLAEEHAGIEFGTDRRDEDGDFDVAAFDDEAARETVAETLSFIHEHAPERKEYVDDVLAPDQPNVYVGEYGWNLAQDPELGEWLVRVMTEASVDWGAPWVLFWQLYSNEPAGEYEGRPTNEDVEGFYLVKPDGELSRVGEYFVDLLERHASE
jgi:hypothetical protein